MTQILSHSSISILPPANPLNFSGQIGNGDTSYTVPAGKTFYCTGIILIHGGAPVNEVTWYVKVAGTQKLVEVVAQNSSSLLQGDCLFSAASGEAITFWHNAGADQNYNMWGYII